ncbi:MAG: CDP-glycerol--glycerophosphate glycerophosphotransferase [Bacteroidetes bacterium GWC2_33_15]|nr:MAG: CDP-glycerol--glycerophosphate glycerophosphotransferase [Bacteroidetes bacterium GWA2_33_15]OFX52597.1 MAG: CDP-glycerol--glycerophosphate glycerophosphotransferase [Bacteroidetes bacterium GWC2_33_15]OFX63942.1 MAG: CDP-glycerol--glycerophosphate glycerophosphotransferase [Bacteroidetes bacterium GWB2_32_14]OFX70791.1 MAG: CDP-glycerol--glycerophosphate glycerophosphotransferase [Bacteroidetes bacterium GWD2_33_33]HAN19919.1 CDP-glycerol--glycerophosphate glycerophosphotransferase [Ba
MRTTLFCKNPYAFGILKPLNDELANRGMPVIWYIPGEIINLFPYKESCNYTSEIQRIADFNNDVLIVPGNEVPHYLRGLKVQVFHGLAGEKKGHFRIRHYFDLYLTQGPYFTERFKQLANKYKDFDVIETGWPKLDSLFNQKNAYISEKQSILKESGTDKIVLYAPTFSPSLTSATALKNEIIKIADKKTVLLIKFHDLMNKKVIDEYREIEKQNSHIRIIHDNNITKYLILADLLISDTSSVVYEFLLLDKPVITFRSHSKHIHWQNIVNPVELTDSVQNTFSKDRFTNQRKWIINNYHPYSDGCSSKRIVETLISYLESHPVPEERKISWFRKRKMVTMFGKIN